MTTPEGSELRIGRRANALHPWTLPQWVMAAARLPGRTLHLAMTLQSLADANKSSRVELTNVASFEFGLDRSAKYRALACLERAGLVRVQRKLGRSPIVTLLCHSIGDNG